MEDLFTDIQFITAILAFVGSVSMFFLGKHAEKRSVNIAILAEVHRLLMVIKSHKDWREKCVNSGRDVVLIPFSTDVYQSQVGNVGVIEREIVANIVRFYGYIEFLNRLQDNRGEYEKQDDLDGFYKTYDGTLKTVIDTFSLSFDQAFKSHKIN